MYVSKACFHGIFCYYIPTLGFTVGSSLGLTLTTWQHSSISFTVLLHIVTYKLFIDGRQLNLLSMISSLLSILFYYISVIVISSPSIAAILDPGLMGVFSVILNDFKVWLMILGLPLFCLLPDISIKIYNTYWNRTPIDW